MTSGFNEWLKENYPDEWRTFELMDEYWTWVSAPLNKLIDECPWIKKKNDSLGIESVEFDKREIADLIQHGYHISVDHRVDRHYGDCRDWTYHIDITISNEDKRIVELYDEGIDSYDDIISTFYSFDSELIIVYDET